MPVLQATDLLATHPACSEKRHYQPCRPPHERKLGDQTKDDADKEPHEERSCGRSQTLLYEQARPHLATSPERDEDFMPFIEVVFHWLRGREKLHTPSFESTEELMTLMLTAMAASPHPLSVKQLARRLSGATMRAAKRITVRAIEKARPTP